MSIPNNHFGKSFEAKAITSYDNNDYVVWAACGLVLGGKQLTHVSCQRFKNVSLSIRSQSAGKMSGGKRPVPAQRGIMVSIKLQRV